MAQTSRHAAPLHEFPYWPLEFLLLYNHAMRDFTRYAQAMGRCTDAMQVVRAEGDYGLHLWQDTMQAYYDLAVLPASLAMKAVSQAPAERRQARAAAD